MDKNKTNKLRKYMSIALQTSKIYIDMGGDTNGISILGALFKWPDVVYDMLDVIDGTGSEETVIKDIGSIMLNPLSALGLAYLETVQLSDKDKEAYKTILSKRTINDIDEILQHRDLMVNILTRLVTLKEKQDENRSCGSGEKI